MPQGLHQANPLVDVYQNGMYPIQGAPGLQGQAAFGDAHLAAHSLQPQSIDGYVLQGNPGHQGLSASHAHGGGFSAVSTYANVNPFGGAGMTGALNDPYQRSTFGYGM
jgi:hypothetical protein